MPARADATHRPAPPPPPPKTEDALDRALRVPSTADAAPAAEPASADAPPAAADPGEPSDPAEPRRAPAAAPGSTPAATTPAPAPAPAPPPDTRKVMAALRAHGEAIDDCVALTPGDEAARGRRFRLVVAVEPSGRVSDVVVDDPEVDGTPLGICLQRLAHGLTFPAFAGAAVRVELPIKYGRAD